MKPLFEPDTVVPTATASPFKTPAVQPAIRPVSAPVPVAAPAPSLRTAPMPVPLTDMELEALGSKATAGLAKLPDQPPRMRHWWPVTSPKGSLLP